VATDPANAEPRSLQLELAELYAARASSERPAGEREAAALGSAGH